VSENVDITSAHILVVDDEPGIVDVLTFALDEAGFTTSVATDGPSALRMALTQPVDLILLDIMLPGLNGLDVCRQVRAVSDVPIIIVSAKGSDAERIEGLELFADDYVVKPFSLGELVARIQTVLRRSTRDTARLSSSAIDSAPDDVRTLSNGLMQLNLETFTATWDRTPIELTRIQFDLLAVLLRRPGIVFPRSQLLTDVWGQSYNDDLRTVDSMVKRLRGKLRDAGAPADLIEARRDRGYLLQPALLVPST
jgi:two-component system, OmpR family, response regulator RegX3